MTDEADRRPYTYEDAARACEVSTETIRAKARRGKLKKGRTTNSGRPTVLLSQAEIDAIRGGRPFRPDGQPPGQPDGQPSGHSSIISQLEGRIAAQEAHIESLQAWLATAEQRASRAEERAEKAEQRLVDELARLAGSQHAQVPSVPESNGLDEAETAEVLAELEAEFAGHAQSGDGQLATVPDADPTSESRGSGEGRGSDQPALPAAEVAPSPELAVLGAKPARRGWFFWRRGGA